MTPALTRVALLQVVINSLILGLKPRVPKVSIILSSIVLCCSPCVAVYFLFLIFTVAQLLPPENVQLLERSIDPVSQSVKMLVGWEPVEQASTDTVGYSVYIDGELYSSVAGIDTKVTELTGLVPNVSLVYIVSVMFVCVYMR